MNAKKKLALAAVAATLLMPLSQVANAATATGTMGVSATISASCASVSGTSLSFGAYDPVGANKVDDLDTTSTITFSCTAGSSVDVGLDMGANEVSGQRYAVGGGGPTDKLKYDLYSDTDRSSPWDDDTNTVNATGTGSAQNLTVYGRAPGNQPLVRAGAHTDTVNINVHY